jgi:predicted ATPase/DNA-binding winged helix-turn-helix (wHTH) protein
LGERAFDVLAVLAKAEGEVVSKDDLMSLVWRGSVVEENALQAHISAIRKALGSDREILKTIAGRGYSLQPLRFDTEREVDGQASPSASRAVALPTSSLPVITSALYGRAEAVASLKSMLMQYRAVTVTGPGGIGKTALSLAVAHELHALLQTTSCFVDLAPIVEPALVASTAASAVGLHMGAETISAELVAARIGANKILLVLDNCEHLISAAAAFVETLLRVCPSILILATSREPLRVEGEYVYRLAPLDVPSSNATDPQSIYASAAVELFVDRMRAAGSIVTLSASQSQDLATICRRLDGIPLAIEFAAARASVLGVTQVAEYLDDRFRLLTGGRRTSLPRQQTLRATLDWSYDLLPPSEQRLLRHLAVFPGGFSVDSVAAVLGDSGESSILVLDGIGNLVAKSLVVVDRIAGRWRLLETIRTYAMEKLAEAVESVEAARRQAQFLCRLFSTDVVEGLGPLNKSNVGRFVSEIDNVRAALDWCFSPAGDGPTGVALTAAYSPAWQHLALMAECGHRVGVAIERRDPERDPEERLLMHLSLQQGVAFGYAFQSHKKTQRAALTALTLAEQLGDVKSQLQARHLLFSTYILSGDVNAALPVGQRLRDIARQSGDDLRIAAAERLVGFAVQMKGDLREAEASFRRALLAAPKQEIDDYSWSRFNERAMARAMLGKALWLRGKVDQAVMEGRRALEEAAAEPYAATRCNLLRHSLCRIEMMTGHLDAAKRSVALLKELSERLGYRVFGMSGICLQGALQVKCGDFAGGTQVLRASLATCTESGWTGWFTEFLAILAEGLIATERYDEAAAAVAEALERSARGGEHWYLPELYRLKGRLAVNQHGQASEAQAEACYRQSLQTSIEQGALFWELKAALDLAQLKKRQNLIIEAREALELVYHKFTEGFGTPDLQAARALLSSLQ